MERVGHRELMMSDPPSVVRLDKAEKLSATFSREVLAPIGSFDWPELMWP